MKRTIGALALVAAGLVLFNLGGTCQRPGCPHYKTMHLVHGRCAFFATDGCTGFLKR